MLPAPPYFAACLHDSRHCTTVGVASSNFYEDGDSQHPRLQPIPSCLRRTFSNRATGSYPVFSVKLKTGGKIRVVPCSTVWLCQSGTRAPLRRRPFRSPSGRNLGKPGPVPERTAPLTHELGVGMGGNSTLRGDELEYWRRPAPWQAVWQRDCRCCSSRARKRSFMARVLVTVSSARNPASSICGNVGVALVRFRNVGV